MADAKSTPKSLEKAAEEVLVTSSDSRFSTVKAASDVDSDAGQHVEEVRGKPNDKKEAI